MHVIWKRPDGYHDASPSDYSTCEIGSHFRLWLHRHDKEQYPFRIAGGWEEKEGTVRLNRLINLLPESDEKWLEHLRHSYDHSMKDDKSTFMNDLIGWLQELGKHVKGDTWEVEILSQALDLTIERLEKLKATFAKS